MQRTLTLWHKCQLQFMLLLLLQVTVFSVFFKWQVSSLMQSGGKQRSTCLHYQQRQQKVACLRSTSTSQQPPGLAPRKQLLPITTLHLYDGSHFDGEVIKRRIHHPPLVCSHYFAELVVAVISSRAIHCRQQCYWWWWRRTVSTPLLHWLYCLSHYQCTAFNRCTPKNNSGNSPPDPLGLVGLVLKPT